MKSSRVAILFALIVGGALFSAQPSPSVIPPENIVRLVFFGKTGAGKSTTITAFYNYAKGVEWDAYPKLFPIKTPYQECNVPEYVERNAEDHSNGQVNAVTQDPSEYTATGNNLVVNLIDCPGVADPRGIERDQKITTDIAKFLSNVDAFNAICVVIPGTVNRATDEERYLFEQIRTIIPKATVDRIFLIITNATMVKANVKSFAEAVGLPVANIFAFDHFAFSEEGHIEVGKGSEDVADTAERTWGKKTFARLIEKAKSLGKFSTSEMVGISKLKSEVSEKIHTALRQVDEIEKTEAKLVEAEAIYTSALSAHDLAKTLTGDTEEALRLAQAEKKIADALDAYEYYYEIVREPTSQINTVCTTCSETCHANCNLTQSNDIDYLQGCSSMRDGYCTDCKGRCSYRQHKHANFAFREEKRTREKLDVKAHQSDAANAVSKLTSSVASKKQDLDSKEKDKSRKGEVLTRITECLSYLKENKGILQNQIIELYLELDKVSMSSINFHIGEYYNKRIARASNTEERLKLELDRRFYMEQVELYKLRAKEKGI